MTPLGQLCHLVGWMLIVYGAFTLNNYLGSGVFIFTLGSQILGDIKNQDHKKNIQILNNRHEEIMKALGERI